MSLSSSQLKRWPQYLVVLILALVQIASTNLIPLIGGNLLLAYFVAASVFFDYNLLIWLALLGGLMLDLYGAPTSFGLNIGFLLLLVIISKLIIRLETQSQRLWYCFLLSLGFSLIFFVVDVGLVVNTINQAAILPLIWKLLGSMVYNGLATVLLFAAFEFALSRDGHKLQYRRGGKR